LFNWLTENCYCQLKTGLSYIKKRYAEKDLETNGSEFFGSCSPAIRYNLFVAVIPELIEGGTKRISAAVGFS